MKSILKYVFGFIMIFSLPSIAYAANLRFAVPANLNQSEFTARILIDSPNQLINAASAVINFQIDKLKVRSISTEHSIFNFWPLEPSFSNDLGTVDFEAVLLGKNWSGTAGELGRINFTIKSGDETELKFVSGSVLSGDGLATNILESSIDANINLGVTTNNSFLMLDLIDSIVPAPQLISYQQIVEVKQRTLIVGQAYHDVGTAIAFVIYPNGSQFEFSALIDQKNFTIEFTPPLPGLYEIILSTTGPDENKSLVSHPIYIYSSEPADYTYLVRNAIILILILLGGIVILIWAHRTHYQLSIKPLIFKKQHKIFKILSDKQQAKQSLTPEEEKVLQILKGFRSKSPK